MVEALVEWAEFIHEHGVERRPGQGRPQGGRRRRPRPTGPACSHEQGDDANASEQRVDLIHKRIDG